MIGQLKLQEFVKNSTLDSFPHSVILVGRKGCGKHLLSSIIAQKLNLTLIDITDNLNLEYINQIYLRSIPSIYLINTSEITEKEQNIILKFLEEPLKNSYIILLSESLNSLLPTIKNRCQVYTFESYTKSELCNFTHDINLLNVCSTPGEIIDFSRYNFNDIYDLCIKFVDKLKDASFVNTLTLSNKINFKDNYDKIDLMLFFKVIIYILREKILSGNDRLYDFYTLTNKYKQMLEMDSRLDKQRLFENYLSNI